MRRLTTKQERVLNYLRRYIAAHGSFPTYRQAAEDLTLKSPNTYTQYLQALTQKGYVMGKGRDRILIADRCCPHCNARMSVQRMAA